MTDDRPATLEEYRHELRRLAADVERPFEGKLSEALALGRSYLDVEMAFVTRVADDIQEPVAVEGEHHIVRDGRAWPLSASYCQCVLEEGGPFETTNASNADEIPELARSVSPIRNREQTRSRRHRTNSSRNWPTGSGGN